MPSTIRRPNPLVWVLLVGVSLLTQQSWTAWHLALHDHLTPAHHHQEGGGTHSDSGHLQHIAGAGHDHGHTPQPSDEHADPCKADATPQSSGVLVYALPSLQPIVAAGHAFCRPCEVAPAEVPRPPPILDHGSGRAPPFCS
ncbi:MAG: hypothetical protein R3E96_16835 [Planctomycetota bacterium]